MISSGGSSPKPSYQFACLNVSVLRCIIESLLIKHTDQTLHPLLQEHHTQLRLLLPQWTTIIQSDIRIKSAVANAADIASRILGIESTPTLDWMPTVIAQSPDLAHRDIMACDTNIMFSDTDLLSTESAQEHVYAEDNGEGFIVEDTLEGEIEGAVDSESLLEDADTEVIWALPVRDWFQTFI